MSILLALAPLLFVLFWSSGFVAAKLAIPFAEPCTFLFLRFAIVVAALLPFVLWKGRPTRRDLAATMLAGGLMQGAYLSCVVWSIYLGLPAGVVALTVSLHPITTALLASATLGERVRPLGWIGFVLGIVGAFLVLLPKLSVSVDEVPLAALMLCAAALPLMSSGTIAQKRLAPGVPPLSATCLQNAGGCIVAAIGALLLETRVVLWTPLMIGSLIWQAAVVSIGAVALLMLMLSARGASRAASVFFLVPAGSAALSYLILDEQLAPIQLAGMVVVTGAVALINMQVASEKATAGR
jgi:drug/metabolite transporter (DMT)-like permease